ncbi:type 1 glutamine amidotransferase [Aerococcus kribbianus]|uniref:Lipid II isoglutaminyl synthase (glutamine-hydrolyzing) subunit GatD n=1 Tax=Aerococcus kribbianus TaxID=2999064 RepID=A0A9X3FNF3_9LACT|nr:MULTISPECIES: adenosylcobyric acid synthase [unclassified Aerococcus]MCZ0716978.1 adenosylcobyric acid synthase [Aerococcus sp. YH-aer221]MCZ0725266.1 adenosylcobyric acid synthase [Aerococcus sp. YH-aer222]
MKKTLRIAHLYGNLMNTYGDNGNLLMFQHLAKDAGYQTQTDLVSIGNDFDPKIYDFVLFGGGQDYEQKLVAQDLQSKKQSLTRYIEDYGVILGVCGGFQLLGEYYINAAGHRLEGIAALDHYTLNQVNSRFIGDIELYNDRFDQKYFGYENHNGRTFLGENTQPLGMVNQGQGNNGEDKTEGVMYKNTFGTYLHGPVLVRNRHFGQQLVDLAIDRSNKRQASNS